MPRFTEHTARLAAEQISEGKALSEIEETELSSLIAMCEAELRERDYKLKRARNHELFNEFMGNPIDQLNQLMS